MTEQKRSPEEQNQHSQEFWQHPDHDEFIQNLRDKLCLSESYLAEQKRKSAWLPSIREKTTWDWLNLLVVPLLITMIAGSFTALTVSKQNEISKQQNEIFKQRDEAEKERNQQALLIEYLDDISELVEKQLLTLNDDDNSKAQRTIARARTLSVLRALDSDRKGELIQFLSAAQLIERDKPILNLGLANFFIANLVGADLRRANLQFADLREVNLSKVNLSEADLRKVNLSKVNLSEADLVGADLRRANLEGADLGEANLEEADFGRAKNLNPKQIKSACNWEKAEFSEEFTQKLAQEPDQKVDCSKWD